jgi:hypothetical protein
LKTWHGVLSFWQGAFLFAPPNLRDSRNKAGNGYGLAFAFQPVMDIVCLIKKFRAALLIASLAGALASCKPREESRTAQGQSPCESAMLVTHAFKCLSELR